MRVATPARRAHLAIGPRSGAPIRAALNEPLNLDRVEISNKPPSSESPNPGPKKGWGRRILRILGWTGVAVGAGAGIVGGIGYAANHDALQAPQITVHTDAELFGAPTTETPRPAPRPSRPTPAPQSTGISITGPRASIEDFAEALYDAGPTQELMQRRLTELKSISERVAAQVDPQSVDVLIDLQAPLPTGERSFLHVGGLDLPSLGVRNLQVEDVPLVLRANTDRVDTGLKVDFESLSPDRHLEGPGLHIGGVRARVRVDGVLTVSGKLDLELDLEGEASQGKLPLVEKNAELREMVDSRIRAGQKLVQHPQAVSLLEEALREQQVSFEATLDSQGKTLADVTFNLWMVGDQNGDGRADIAITQHASLDELEQLEIEVTRLQHTGTPPDTLLGGYLNETVGQHFLKGAREAVPEVTGQLRRLGLEKLNQALGDGNVLINQLARDGLQVAYQAAEEGVEIPTQSDLFPALPVGLADVHLQSSGDVVVGLHSQGSHNVEGAVNLAAGHRTPRGTVSVTLQGELVDQQLRDRSEGGGVDWQRFLDSLEGGRLKSIEFGRDARGRTIYPRLTVYKGRPAVKMNVVARFKGLIPLPGDLLGSKLHTGIVVPLRITHEGHNLHVKPDGRRVEFTNPESEEPLDLGDLLPTRLLTRAFVTFLSRILGPGEIGEQADRVDLGLDFERFGVNIERVTSYGRSGETPDLVFDVEATDATAEWVGQELQDRL